MALQGVDALPCVRVPQLRGLVKTSCDDLVSEGIVERDRIHDVLVAVQCQQLLAAQRVPDAACPVIGPGDELGPGLVERAIRQRQDVGPQDLEQVKPLVVLVLDLVHQLEDHRAQGVLLVLRDQRLLEHDLVDEHLHVRVGREVQQVDGLRLDVSLPALILQHDARREVPQQEALQLHGARGGGPGPRRPELSSPRPAPRYDGR
mmetsp:Transcript_115380/g.322524  ORF Transcript_115380/g.322524 Transcript_115380/m.322524 type:complete len:204 (+) Transcript_115380:154-765(+)